MPDSILAVPSRASTQTLKLAEGFGLEAAAKGLFEGGQAGRGVYETLREQIVRLELPPGTPLPRAQLANALGVSVTPLRDALQQLAEEGLVLIYPQSRTLVAPIDVVAIREAQFLRLALETEVVRLLADGIRPEDMNRLQGIHKLQSSLASEPESVASFQELDELFHQALFAGANHRQCARLLRSHSGHLDRLRRLFLPGDKAASEEGHLRMDVVIQDHTRILETIAAGDASGAAETMRTHLRRTVDRLSDKRAAYPEYFA